MTAALSDAELIWAADFVRDRVRPLESLPFTPELRSTLVNDLGAEVRARGLWAPHLRVEDGGAGFSWAEIARIFEVLGTSPLAPLAFGCWPPDSVNAQMMAECVTEAQRERWLRPLIEGEITTAFAMTEPDAGSDPSLLGSRAEFVDGEWVLNGRKIWITNGSRADMVVALFVTGADERGRPQASLFLVPRDTPGFTVVRDLPHIGNPDGSDQVVDLHSELDFTDVRLPGEALLGQAGDGFRLAQLRLAAARLQHCMRWISLAEEALTLMSRRAATRRAHGGLLADKATVQHYIARAATGIHLSRLLVTDTARLIDEKGTRAARVEIAMCKVYVANVLGQTIDDAIQVHGAAGISADFPLEAMARFARGARLLDGPDEVHEMVISRSTVAARATEETV
ncbi:acyl-CoA dehydrogenase family protein [Leifsonia bigeumensis]|uniref:Acyl-CoA dehydrogenase family protein n=1 Tax=Leifsonella bigeumensis TaxID=433643 RepID=A0ABP7F6T8_9MICO